MPPKVRKQPYLSAEFAPRTAHGGDLRAGRRKLSRPIDPRRPMHLTLRSEKACSTLSLLSRHHEKPISELVSKAGKRYQVRIYQYANSGNHLHLLVRGKTRKGLQDFLRYIAGKIAQHVTGAKKGNAFGKFWSALAYSRVVEWGKAYFAAKKYVFQNELEATREIPYQARKRGPIRP